MKRRMKILLETHCHFAVDNAPTLEKIQRDGYNIIVKSSMTAPKEVSYIVGITTWEAKYHEVSISYLYLIN
jgi:hypothetical protein